MVIFTAVIMIVALILGVIVGYVAGVATKATHNLIGTLRVDNSIPEDGPQLFLELETGIPDIKTRDYVTLRVNVQNYISHK